MDTKTRSKRLIYWAAGLSMFALVAHSIAAPDHFNEWWVYVAVSVVVAVMQFFYGIALLIQPWQYDSKGGRRVNAEYYGKGYFILGIVLASFQIFIYLVSRTLSLTFLGEDVAAEPVTLLGLVPVLINMISLFPLVKLLRRARTVPGTELTHTKNSNG